MNAGRRIVRTMLEFLEAIFSFPDAVFVAVMIVAAILLWRYRKLD
jgi:hypothetical protein